MVRFPLFVCPGPGCRISRISRNGMDEGVKGIRTPPATPTSQSPSSLGALLRRHPIVNRRTAWIRECLCSWDPIVNRRTAWIRECLCSWEKERVNDGEPCIYGEPHHHHGQRRPTTPNHPLLLLGQQISTPLCSQLYPNRGCLYGFATCTHHHQCTT
jgi:hypothetical protein